MVRGLGHPQPFLGDRDALAEFAELAQTEHQPHAGVNGREKGQPEALQGEVSDESLDVPPEEHGAVAVSTEVVVDLSEVRVRGDLERKLDERVRQREGALARFTSALMDAGQA